MLNKVGSWKIALLKAQSDKIRKSVSLLIGICVFFFGISSNAQCAMCRAALESEGNGIKAEAVNDGILYLMAIPYILVGALGIVIYRMYRNKNEK